jgi:ubiquinone/menaquinone biosynthesis C-methylase UbiE
MIRRFTAYFLDHLYTNFAWGYDFIANIVSFGNWNNWINNIVPFINGPEVLELGHGPGHLQSSLVGSNFSVYGIDQSFQMSQLTKKRLAQLETGNTCVNGKAQQLPYINNHFDTVVTTFPTVYINDHETLLEIKRVLKPGGTLLILLAVWISDKSIIGAILAQIYRLTGQTPEMNNDRSQFTQPFENAGFTVEIAVCYFNGDRLLVINAKA